MTMQTFGGHFFWGKSQNLALMRDLVIRFGVMVELTGSELFIDRVHGSTAFNCIIVWAVICGN